MDHPDSNQQNRDEVVKNLLDTLNIDPTDGINEMRTHVDEAHLVWQRLIKDIRSAEEVLQNTYIFNDAPKLYAIDALTVFHKLNMDNEQRLNAAKLFTLYYLAVHLFDDAVEDKAKLASKFQSNNNGAIDIASLVASFALEINLIASKILVNAPPDQAMEFLRSMNVSLGKQFKYFLVENETNISPEEVLEIKQHCVSGEATSFIVECAVVNGLDLGTSVLHLKKALYYLGSLTQFTDDLRDMDEDMKNSNLNLINVINQSNAPKNTFVQMYSNDQKLMLESLEKVPEITGTAVFIAIPWYPFFIPKSI